MSQHIPAWKRINIKRQQQDPTNNHDDDPLNISTHLATGSLTKKQKQKIIRGDDREKMVHKGKKPKTETITKKKEKLPREKRDAKRQNVLKDQLRYLIDFYLSKVNDQGMLPQQLYSLTNVRSNYPEKFGAGINHKDEEQDTTQVVDVWKFSKQKQNWLIKHFFNVEQLPAEYDDLLLSYFKELRSPAIKNRVAAACVQNVKQWNEYIEKQEEKMKSIVEEEPDEHEKHEQEKDGKQEENTENLEQKQQERKADGESELIPPDKRVVSRSQQLLKLWQIEPSIELRSFYDETS
ncbi:YCR016W [Zygosaccharomyces parabailii]|nr:YCR016W [Zygosaccharomyces parabailii]